MKRNSELSVRLKHLLGAFKFPLISVVVGFLVGGVIIALSGSNGWAGVKGLITGGFGSKHALTTTLNRATPIIFAGLSSALAWGSGYSSMGIAGQMVLGAFTTSIVALVCPGPAPVVVAVSLLAGMVAGMLYSLFAAWISARFEASLLIITLMLNYIASNATSYFTTYTFRDPTAADRLAVQTQKIEAAILPRLFPKYTMHWGFVLAVLFVLIMLFITKRTSFGYKARMSGLNPKFAEYGGVNSLKTMYLMMLLSGAMAGLGGAAEVLGTRFRYIDNMITSPGYAWSGITASLMSSNHPLGVMVSSIFLAGLTTGGAFIELSMNTPSEITAIIQGVLTMLVTAKFAIGWAKKNRISKRKKGVTINEL